MQKDTHPSTKALFLDRDGIINIDHGYVYQIEDFEFMKDIFTLAKLFSDADYKIFVVTNQSGIGRGYYTLDDFKKLSHWMKEQFSLHHLEISHIYYCPHAPEEKCHCRKPEIGMMEQCLAQYDIDLTKAWMIGDKQSDIDFAHQANIKHTIAIREKSIQKADYFFHSISECKRYLEENQGKIHL